MLIIIDDLEVLADIIDGFGHLGIEHLDELHGEAAAVELGAMEVIEILEILGEVIIDFLRFVVHFFLQFGLHGNLLRDRLYWM